MMLPDCEFLCILNWDERLYQEALLWVDDTRRVAMISEKIRESEDPRVEIHCVDSFLQSELIARKIGLAAVFKSLHVMGEGPFKEKVERCHLAAGLILSEAADYWVHAMRNARSNDGPYRRGLDLKGAFENIPAIVVGAGPSLKSNLHYLKEWQSRALIFAGGSALNVIDVEPHFAGSIDPLAPYRQFKMHPFSEAPFCYQSRMNSDNFSLVHGEKLLFPDSSCELINWIYGEETFDSGWTVGNFLTEVAIHLGCSPIYFIGMDLCYENGRKYAKIEPSVPQELVQMGDVWTQKDWIMAARWTEERGVKMFDLSRGILRVPKMEAKDLHLPFQERDLREMVHEKIGQLALQKGGRFDEWEASLRRCKGRIEESEIVYQKLLQPLWAIWRPIFERENQNLELHQALFFQKVIEEHETFVLPKR